MRAYLDTSMIKVCKHILCLICPAKRFSVSGICNVNDQRFQTGRIVLYSYGQLSFFRPTLSHLERFCSVAMGRGRIPWNNSFNLRLSFRMT